MKVDAKWISISVQTSNKSVANSPAKPSAPEGPARMVLAVPDEPARGRKPFLRDELAAVATMHRYLAERLWISLGWSILVLSLGCTTSSNNPPGQTEANPCLANKGQPCDCGGISGTLTCDINNQPVCDCPPNTSGNAAPPTGGTGGVAPVSGSGGGPSAGSGGATVPDTAVADVMPLDSGTTMDGGTTNILDAQVDAVITPVDSSDPWPETGRFPPVDDVWADGPYAPITVNNTGPSNAYTLFHPQELAPNGALNPILSWGNGMATNPAMYPNLLPHLASHGFVIIAANTSSVTGPDIRSGIDWLIEQNQAPASPFYQKLDPNNVAAFGYSMGSLGTFDIADDPRLTTTVHISGGAFGGASVRKLHKPAAYFCDELTTAPNCQPDFDIAPVPVFYGVFRGADHVGTMFDPHMSRVAGATTAWLRWFLMGDETQKAQFVGDSCGLCTDPNWIVQQKDLN